MYIISKDTENAIIINKCHWEGGVMAFTLNDAGEIGSQDHAIVTKILDFIHKLEGGKVIFFQLFHSKINFTLGHLLSLWKVKNDEKQHFWTFGPRAEV